MEAAGAVAAAEVELLLLRVDSAIASRCGGGGEEISREVLVLVDMDRAGREEDGAAAADDMVHGWLLLLDWAWARRGSNYSTRCINSCKRI